MNYLNTVDYCVIGIYFTLLVGVGFYLQKKASSSIEDYVVGNRSLPWWALGISGTATWLDIAGTMLIVSFLYILGPRGLYIEFRGGAGLLLPFMLLWVGKWLRRSNALTPAEWMIFRFGDGFGGRFAQLSAALGGIFTTVGMLAYLIKALGLFLSTFLPFTPLQCTLVFIGIATVYTMVSGFYGVVFTDLIQGAIVIIAVFIISSMAISKVSAAPDFSALAANVTGQSNWTSSALSMHADLPKGYEVYRNLFMFAMFYLFNNIFRGMGFPGDPRYFGARNDRECGLLSLMWTVMLMFRWPLMISFAILGIFLVNNLFPDQSTVEQATEVIQQQHPEVAQAQWPTLLSNIANQPEQYPELTDKMKHLLGDKWEKKILLLSYQGTVNPERIMPAVLLFNIPPGMRGLLLIALIAASMSTFDSNVHLAAGMMTRDIYQKYIRPKAGNREIIYMTWAFVVLLVTTGFLMAYSLKSVNEIWGWLVMGLGAGALVPAFLRLYWWRFNGGGFSIGTVTGVFSAIILRFGAVAFQGDPKHAELYAILTDERWMFSILLVFGLIGSVAGTFLTKKTDQKVLDEFYKTTKPFGLWNGLQNKLPENVRKKMRREHKNDWIALPFLLVWHVCLLLIPMQFIVQNFKALGTTLVIFLFASAGFYWFWFKKLPKDNLYNEEEDGKL
ncbi:sodium:solute symporter family transporter [Sedimentisphaera salicampi]|uniref:sodium:solute symporter family transporter n=1 Tax=Sedimentisphaera salicampi TaxID=1941349 RepID=UPI000B9A3FAE|nr:sodium:solute symporter [Sedimentisphaera salicampi]OXU14902.1 Na(+)/glucose symporter [Sedimentisphaera salicampi]